MYPCGSSMLTITFVTGLPHRTLETCKETRLWKAFGLLCYTCSVPEKFSWFYIVHCYGSCQYICFPYPLFLLKFLSQFGLLHSVWIRVATLEAEWLWGSCPVGQLGLEWDAWVRHGVSLGQRLLYFLQHREIMDLKAFPGLNPINMVKIINGI